MYHINAIISNFCSNPEKNHKREIGGMNYKDSKNLIFNKRIILSLPDFDFILQITDVFFHIFDGGM